jgi:hypothetical protein
MGFGAFFTWLMMLVRSRYAGFPLHPLGYLMCLAFPAKIFWFSIFIGWLAKSVVMRYGGIEAYRRLIPAFLGLVVGEVSMILFWLVVDGWLGRTGHQLMPG